MILRNEIERVIRCSKAWYEKSERTGYTAQTFSRKHRNWTAEKRSEERKDFPRYDMAKLSVPDLRPKPSHVNTEIGLRRKDQKSERIFQERNRNRAVDKRDQKINKIYQGIIWNKNWTAEKRYRESDMDFQGVVGLSERIRTIPSTSPHKNRSRKAEKRDRTEEHESKRCTAQKQEHTQHVTRTNEGGRLTTQSLPQIKP
ncbi:hypothetical protein J6590_054440 [Homalodisca vitripennis]|nr:hypothetical protein J6590_054440 [Homalodisca vitripennis]